MLEPAPIGPEKGLRHSLPPTLNLPRFNNSFSHLRVHFVAVKRTLKNQRRKRRQTRRQSLPIEV
jgi:hypothetical protein